MALLSCRGPERCSGEPDRALRAPLTPRPSSASRPATSVVSTLRATDPESGLPAVDAAARALGDRPAVQHRRAGPRGGVRPRRARRRVPGAARGQRGRVRRTPARCSGRASSPPGGRRTCGPSSTASAGAGVSRVTVTVAGGQPADGPAHRRRCVSRRPAPLSGGRAARRSRVERADGSARTFASVERRRVRRRRPVRRARLEAQRVRLRTAAGASARLRTGCVNFATARAVPDEPNVSSTPVCGLEPNRPGVKRKPLFFATRRLSGSGPSSNFLAGNWHHHAARVAVWGIARGAKRIVVRAGALRLRGQAAAQRRLPRLPAALDAARAPSRVQVDGRRATGSTLRHRCTPPKHGARRRRRASAATVPVGRGRARAPGRRPLRARARSSTASTTRKFAVTLDDPAGGLPWVLRAVRRRARGRGASRRARSPGRSVVGRSRCVQLGRLQRRDVRLGLRRRASSGRAGIGVPAAAVHVAQAPGAGGRPGLDPGLADAAAPSVTGSVVWGFLPGATEATVAGSGSADGAGEGHRRRLPAPRRGRTRGRDGASVSGGGRTRPARRPRRCRRAITAPPARSRRWSRAPRRSRRPRPDPAGGAALRACRSARRSEGVPCAVGPTRVVGDRGGDVDLRLAPVHRAAS